MEQNETSQVVIKPNNNMALAIFSTVCCCLPIGIYAIIKASKVDDLFNMKQYDEANAAAEDAKKFALIGIGVGLFFIIMYFFVYVVAASAVY